MKTRYAVVIGFVLIAVTLLYTMTAYARLPHQIPMHWNINGKVDGWGEKGWAIYMCPGFMAFMIAMILVLPVISPRQFKIEPFEKTFNYVMVLLMGLFGYIQFVMLQSAASGMDMGRMLIGGMFICFALMGNVLGRVRHNFWMGWRTPWTLSSDEVWNGTHRMAGRLTVVSGILGAIGLATGVPMAICFTGVILAMLYPMPYSYILYRRIEKAGRV